MIRGKYFDKNLIPVNDPTCYDSADHVEASYALKQNKYDEITLVLGDFNAKIGQSQEVGIE